MPIVQIQMWEGQSKEAKRRLIERVSLAVAESLDLPIEYVEIVITDVAKDNWGKHGKQASELKP